MKTIFIILICFYSCSVLGQDLPDYGLDKVRITLADKTIVAELEPVSSNPSAKSDLFYYWYSANAVHQSQGGYSGKLLNGLYNEYYLNKNLRQQGNFKNGLKDGLWKRWNDDGTLALISKWRHGVEVSGKHVSVWKRLNVFKKKPRTTDTLNQAR